jgi:hypothetical protein
MQTFGESELDRIRNQQKAGGAQAIIDAALGVPEGERGEVDQQILEAGQGRVAAIKAYWNSIVSGSKQKISEAAAALVAAENHWSSVVGGAGEGNTLVGAFETLFGTTETDMQASVKFQSDWWKSIIGENAEKAQALIDTVGKKLATGKITWQQAREQLFGGLKDMGVDVNTIGQVLGDTFQGALIEAVGEVTKAVQELIDTIKRLRGEVANPISGPRGGGSGGGRTQTPRFLSSTGQPIGFETIPGIAAANTVAGGIAATAPSPVVGQQSVIGSQQVAAFRRVDAAAQQPSITVSAPVTVQGNVRSDSDLSAAIAENIRDETIRIVNRLGSAGSLYGRPM